MDEQSNNSSTTSKVGIKVSYDVGWQRRSTGRAYTIACQVIQFASM